MDRSAAVPPVMRFPPPLMFALAFLAGVALQRLVPLPFPASAMLTGRRVAGVGLAVCGALLALSSVGIFVRSRTTVIPFSTASTLVTWGPYRFTRNPMYVGLTLVYVGLAIALAELWPLFLLPLPLLFLQTIVIPFEERRMREIFGETYDTYRARVRRWL